ncbi:MAG TPA: hypothetical protein VFG03_12425 [Telluria sp.]|jgi:hypothetical protein|nr:hypothetical protein [Telluria sp.]
MDDFLAMLEWPAMGVSLLASWWMASRQAQRRVLAFWALIVGNLLWIAWGWGDDAWALIALQVGLIALNLRGIVKNEDA